MGERAARLFSYDAILPRLDFSLDFLTFTEVPEDFVMRTILVSQSASHMR